MHTAVHAHRADDDSIRHGVRRFPDNIHGRPRTQSVETVGPEHVLLVLGPMFRGAECIHERFFLPVGTSHGEYGHSLEDVRPALRIYEPPAVSDLLSTEEACSLLPPGHPAAVNISLRISLAVSEAFQRINCLHFIRSPFFSPGINPAVHGPGLLREAEAADQ